MSMPRDRLRDYVRDWIRSAGNDRETLQLLGVDPADTHVIGDLVGQLHRFDRRLVERLGPVDRLTRYAVTTRYPARPSRPAPTVDAAQVAADVALARSACAVLDETLAERLTALAPSAI